MCPERAAVALFDVLDDAIVVLDAGGVIQRANAAAVKLLGCSERQLTGTPFPTLVSAEERAKVAQQLASIALPGPPVSLELTLSSSQPPRVGVIATFAPSGVLALEAIGVALRRRRTAADEHDQQVLAAMMQVVGSLGTSVKELGGGAPARWNPAMYELMGLPPGTPIGPKTVSDVIHPDDREAARELRQRALARREGHDLELRIVRPGDGGQRWVRVLTQVVRGAEGQPDRVIDVVRDITEARATFSALAASEEQLRQILASTSDGVLIHDRQGKITFANRRVEQLLGYGHGELNGQHAAVLVPAERRASLATRLEERLAGVAATAEASYLHASGALVPMQVRVEPLLDGQGQILGGLITMRDLSAEKAAAEKVRKLEDQLRSAQKLEAIGSLAAGIAHDFNNLLTVILSNSSLALEELPPGHAAGLLAEVHKAGIRASELTRQLLAFGRKQLLRPTPTDLSQLVHGLLPMLKRLLPEDIALDLSCPPGLSAVMADKGQLEQVVVNLCVNARDAMPQGGKLTVKVEEAELDDEFVKLHLGTRPGRHLKLSVTDNGVGMTKEIQEHIFEPFFSTKGDKGTGLGLSTTFGIVKQSGGTIWVYSEPGQGTSFKIYLPACAVEAAGAAAVPVAPAKGKGETVLVVEDDPQVRKLICQVLKRNGYQVLEAASPEHALEAAAKPDATVSLLLSDVVMPGMNGRELADRLRSTRPALKVLLMSGYTDDAVLKKGVLAGTCDFMEKPLTPAGLLARVRELLDR